MAIVIDFNWRIDANLQGHGACLPARHSLGGGGSIFAFDLERYALSELSRSALARQPAAAVAASGLLSCFTAFSSSICSRVWTSKFEAARIRFADSSRRAGWGELDHEIHQRDGPFVSNHVHVIG